MDRLHSQKIWDIASALRLPSNGSPADAILKFCEQRAATMLADFPDCATPSDLLDIMAAILGTTFEVVRSDEELAALQRRYVQSGEFGFASLDKELHGDVYGVTYRRMTARTGERAFVSVIDCRGDKGLRSYFTKWHEIGHLLILTDQQRSIYKRTHARASNKDPEETLVDLIAGHMGFFPQFFLPEIGTDVTFADVDRIRGKLCPEASFLSSAIAYAKHHGQPCLLIDAKLALKKERRGRPSPRIVRFLRSAGAEAPCAIGGAKQQRAATRTLHSEELSRSGVFCYPSGAQRGTGSRSRSGVPFALGVLGWQVPRT